MSSHKKNYKLPGLLFSILVHALVLGFVFMSSTRLFKGQLNETPVDFYVFPSVNNKKSDGLSHAKATAKPTVVKEASPIQEIKPEVKTTNDIATEDTGKASAAPASSAFADVTDDALLTSPVEALKIVKIPYPKEAKDAGIKGNVVMMLLIDETGQVRDVKVLSGPGHGLNEAAGQAAKSFLFKPAQVKDKKVSVLIRYTYRFNLDNI